MTSLFDVLHEMAEDAQGSKAHRVLYFAMSEILASAASGNKACFVMANSMPFDVSKRELNRARKALKRHGLQVTAILGGYWPYFIASWEDNADLEA